MYGRDKKKTNCTVLFKQIFKHLVLTQVIIFHGLQSLNCPTNEICHTYLRVCRAGLFLTDHLFSPVIDIRACWNIQKKYWIPVLEAYWSIITSMAFQIIPDKYQYLIRILRYFPVSLSVFQKKIKVPKFWIMNISIDISRTSVKSPSISIWRIKRYFPVFHCYVHNMFWACSFYVLTELVNQWTLFCHIGS